MSDTETSQSILDNNGLLITEPANEEPDQEVEDELLESRQKTKIRIFNLQPHRTSQRTDLRRNQNKSQAENALLCERTESATVKNALPR